MRRIIGEEVRSAVANSQNAEPKAPKAIVEELKSLNSSIQSQEPAMRRAVAEELRAVVASLQNAEPKVPKAILDEIRAVSANAKAQETRPQSPQASLVDQIKVLQASVEALKARLSEERGRGDSAASADIAQLRQLVATASDQFGKCQTQLASIGGPGSGAAAQQAATATAAAITVSQERKAEPAGCRLLRQCHAEEGPGKAIRRDRRKALASIHRAKAGPRRCQQAGFRPVVRRAEGVSQPGCRVRNQPDGNQSQRGAGARQHLLQALK